MKEQFAVDRRRVWTLEEVLALPLRTERIRFVDGTEAAPATEAPPAGAPS
jgi:hypothetical protein